MHWLLLLLLLPILPGQLCKQARLQRLPVQAVHNRGILRNALHCTVRCCPCYLPLLLSLNFNLARVPDDKQECRAAHRAQASVLHSLAHACHHLLPQLRPGLRLRC